MYGYIFQLIFTATVRQGKKKKVEAIPFVSNFVMKLQLFT